ncbi:MAG: thermonuclease family protein [Nitrospira sp.]|nr:thermonuclease family protein [Nitrospira sp.]
MKIRTVPALLTLLLFFLVSLFPNNTVSAEPLSKSDLSSTLQPQCDLCWNPDPSEQRSDRLPTWKRRHPPRPPDSRPQRHPKGRYKLNPDRKPSRLSTLRARAREEIRLRSTRQATAVDGDTIRVGGERIRLRGIDTPELDEPEGLAAKQRLEELLRSGPMEIIPHGRDVYDRLIADVFVNGQNVAEILKSEGFTKTY